MGQDAELGSDEWCTGRDLARMLGRFDMDPCSNERSHIDALVMLQLDSVSSLERKADEGLDLYGVRLERHLGRQQADGLAHDWGINSVFVNPPYSNPLPWCLKLAQHPGPWCALLKLDPSTKWWAALMEACPTVAPFRRRLKFERPDKPPMTANFPSVLVYSAWRPSRELAALLWLPTYATARSAS